MGTTTAVPEQYWHTPSPSRGTSAGVDFITCTQRQDDAGREMYAEGHKILTQEVMRGNVAKEGRWCGYRTHAAGSVLVGARNDDVLVRLSGHCARDHWLTVARFCRNVSRLDLQVTEEHDPPFPTLARQGFRRAPGRTASRGRPSRVRLVANREGGDTLYLGSRQSQRFGRIYDKGVESGSDPVGRRWRYELEMKSSMALNAASLLSVAEDESATVAGIVQSALRAWGVVTPWDCRVTAVTTDRPPLTDLDRSLQWLTEGVSPTVARLCAAGRELEVIDALGLSHLLTAGGTNGNPRG